MPDTSVTTKQTIFDRETDSGEGHVIGMQIKPTGGDVRIGVVPGDNDPANETLPRTISDGETAIVRVTRREDGTHKGGIQQVWCESVSGSAVSVRHDWIEKNV